MGKRSTLLKNPPLARLKSSLVRMRTLDGMAVARAKGKLRGKKFKLLERQQKKLRRMYDTGDYAISDASEGAAFLPCSEKGQGRP